VAARGLLSFSPTALLLRCRELLNHDHGHGVPPGVGISGSFIPATSYVYSHLDGPRGNSLAETSNLSCFIVSLHLKGVIKSEVFWHNENSGSICFISWMTAFRLRVARSRQDFLVVFDSVNSDYISFPGSTRQERPQLNKIKTGMLEVLVERFLCALKSFVRIYDSFHPYCCQNLESM